MIIASRRHSPSLRNSNASGKFPTDSLTSWSVFISLLLFLATFYGLGAKLDADCGVSFH